MRQLKIISTLFLFVILFNFTDIVISANDQPSNWAKNSVNEAIQLGYVPESLQSNYQAPITREEFAELFVTALFSDFNDTLERYEPYKKLAWHFDKLTLDNFLSKVSSTQVFTDTDSKYVKVANMLGIVNGNTASTFNPDGIITREQAAIMIANYAQTQTLPNNADKEDLSDYDDISIWARQGVIFTYEELLMNGTVTAVTDDNGNYVRKAVFSPKTLLTREQAIMIINRLGRKHGRLLNSIIIRGYVWCSIDALMSGISIDGNTVRLKRSNYNNVFSDLNLYLEPRGGEYDDYINNYASEKLTSIFFTPPGPTEHMFSDDKIKEVMLGLNKKYDYGCYTVEYNTGDFLSEITLTDSQYYFGFGRDLFYGDLINGENYIPVVFVGPIR